MTTAAAHPANRKKNAETSQEEVQSVRETIESIVVAFILAFLFRAFVAEAFVIPTGSMAPTLMGAHKDTVCEHCGKQYQASASNEFDSNTGSKTEDLVVASTCPNCRGLNAYDLANNANHASFSGDRILVSKFDYVLHNPERWDVIVFKYPLNARMNYIKRLVGLPGEHLLVKGGDVYVRNSEAEAWTIARKPPHKIRAMRQTVADTKYQPAELVAAGWPSLWQAAPSEQPTAPNWKVTQSPNQWSAELTASGSIQWLRYYHKFLTSDQWKAFDTNKQMPSIDPLSSRLITDYQAYNTSYITKRANVYEPNRKMRQEFQGAPRPYFNLEPYQVSSDRKTHSQVPPHNDSEQWVGDLAGDFDLDISGNSGILSVMLVESGIEFRCDIDIATGTATLQAMDEGKAVAIFTASGSPETTQLTGNSTLRGAGKHRLEIANFDDQIVVWANGKVVKFDGATTFNFDAVRNASERRPYWTPQNPLDAAPVAMGGNGLAMKVERAKVWRDIYYIAMQNDNYSDFPMKRSDALVASIPSDEGRAAISTQPLDRSQAAIASTYEHPEWWSETNLFNMRNERNYQLAIDHYFPMGDNSAQSADARAWRDDQTGADHNYVEQRFMLGKALVVFWPHYWNRPIPFFPNFSRMGLIR